MRCIEYQQGTANQCFMSLLGSFIFKEKVSYKMVITILEGTEEKVSRIAT